MCPQLFRDEMGLVPELHCSEVADSAHDKAAGARPIGGQDWLPYDEYSQMIRVILPQHLLDCGSPPQADWSSRRNQHQHAVIVRGIVELSRELGEIAFVKGDQPAA
jgi:hypothetical protein